MVTNRRDFMLQGVAAGVMVGLPGLLHAQMAIGNMTLDVVSDGHLTLPGSFIFGPMPKDDLMPILNRLGQEYDQLTPPCNLSLLRGNGRVVLFDAGSGSEFMPTAGKMMDALDALGVAPEDITDLVLTHGHPDHLWGVLDDFGDALFTNATHYIGQTEWDYWTDPNTVNTIDSGRQAFAVGAARRLGVVAEQMQFFKDGDEVLPGVGARMTPGHTPGHMAFEVRAENTAVMIVGDSIGNDHIALARPAWESGSDQDPARAAKTRVGLINDLATANMPIVGFHLGHGGLGRIEKTSDGFTFRTDL
ncbi:MBL fold metallo-hydrolase [Sulfitobacter sp. AS59]|uniref:MBL fold metallo-hydrolase n=1 Tax=Sulfitobacter sp. AS59 TaxID=3135784 RepID=UPI00317F768D